MVDVAKKFLDKSVIVGEKADEHRVEFKFGNGQVLVGRLSEFSPEIVTQLALHGLSQKGGDATSGFSKDRDFLSGVAATGKVLENLRNGIWSGSSGGGNSDLVTVLAELQGIEVEAAQAAVDKATVEQLAGLKKHPAVKAAIAKLQEKRAKEAAKGAPKLDTLMKELGL